MSPRVRFALLLQKGGKASLGNVYLLQVHRGTEHPFLGERPGGRFRSLRGGEHRFPRGLAQVVAGAHHPPVGAGVGDQEDVPLGGGGQPAGAAEDVAGLADRPDDVGGSVAGSSSRLRFTIGW